jgi:hypothetical protein
MSIQPRRLFPAALLAVLILPALAQHDSGSANPEFAQGDFYIVSSIDLAKKQILLKRPTEVTELMRVDSETRYFDEQAKTIRLTDLRAGDTVYIVSKPGQAQSTAVTIRKGPMTQEVLRQRYLNNRRN